MFDTSSLEKLPLRPEKSSYSFNHAINTITTNFTEGLTHSRTSYKNNVYTVQVEWHFSAEEYAYFQAFYQLYTAYGINPFLIDLIIDESEVQEFTVKFVPDTLEISEPGQYAFIVNAELEVYPIDNTDYQAILVLVYEDAEALYSLTDAISQFANVDCEPL